MLTPRIRSALVALAASAALAGCTNMGPYGGIGVGVGSGYGGYGGYSGYGYDPYYAGYGYRSAYGYNPYGWYNGYYYPGNGGWVYDRDRNKREMTPAERAYWEARLREHFRNKYGDALGPRTTAQAKENWSGFAKPEATANAGTSARADQRPVRQAIEARRQAQAEQQLARSERQQEARSERQQVRAERQESIRQQVMERRQARRPSKSADD